MADIMLITGGSRGIGAATALLAASRGYAVAVSYLRDEDAAARVVDEIRAHGGVALAIAADVSREEDVVRLFQTVDRDLGPIAALVNNAGVLDRQARLEDMSAARVERVLSTNVVGSFLCAREAVRRMSTLRGGRGGAIVNVSSRASQLGSPGEYIDYAASKAAVDTLTIGLAKEVAAEGIRVNAVRPGIIATDIHASGGDPGRVERLQTSLPLGRAGSPEEVARAILWLASSESSYCTGSLLDVAGGR
ncbi:SDR family oxidoreductase [Sorangium sp. So ce327]|jgi:NAD(P)-dependent dehydrogenase (short-subunit alcohol dehydrogenase family)|uniref:SDR family oxidoreductase n=1 Tax=Sorangium sp. So ce327 TaxID=3133301 RepID=UPI003F63CA47